MADANSKSGDAVVSGIPNSVTDLSDLREDLLQPNLTTPIPRIGTPEEVACLVSYIASDGAGFVTGKWTLLEPSLLFNPLLRLFL
jgi:NAD(P)-dependent dehydrogenase (short-subunit alcohol dehydrogenase family)